MFAETKSIISMISNVIVYIILLWTGFIPSIWTISNVVCLGSLWVIQRRVAGGTPCAVSSKLTGKIALVTGSNSGIGEATASSLAAMDCTVIYACRTEAKARDCMAKVKKSHPKAKLHFVRLDLGDNDSVRSCVTECQKVIADASGATGLDFLINNGGVMVRGNTTQRSASGHEINIGTNFVGHVLLTELLLPLVKSAKGRIVNVSSSSIRWVSWPTGNPKLPLTDLLRKTDSMEEVKKNSSTIGPGMWGYYCSKWANCCYTKHLSKRVKKDGIRVTTVHPGFVATDIVRMPLIGFLTRTVGLLFCKTSKEGAQTSLHCALVGTGVVTGSYYADCVKRDDMVPSKIENTEDVQSVMKYCFDSLKLPMPLVE